MSVMVGVNFACAHYAPFIPVHPRIHTLLIIKFNYKLYYAIRFVNFPALSAYWTCLLTLNIDKMCKSSSALLVIPSSILFSWTVLSKMGESVVVKLLLMATVSQIPLFYDSVRLQTASFCALFPHLFILNSTGKKISFVFAGLNGTAKCIPWSNFLSYRDMPSHSLYSHD